MRSRYSRDAGTGEDLRVDVSRIRKDGAVKSGIKKSMRVATTFTGAAACAVTFGPTAMAGTHIHQQADERHGQHPLRGMAARKGNFESGPCTGGTSNWVHMAFGQPNAADFCFGFRGSGSPDSTYSLICGGNNIGWYSGSSRGGKPVFGRFHEGSTYVKLPGEPDWINGMGITSFSGHDKCPPATTIITSPRR
jgi:hypothetical protein